jgi:hypothetical protein
VAERAPDKTGDLLFVDMQVNQTVGTRAEAPFPKAVIQGEKSRSIQGVQEPLNLVVFHPEPPHLGTDATDGDPPVPKKPVLVLPDVFINPIHADRLFREGKWS